MSLPTCKIHGVSYGARFSECPGCVREERDRLRHELFDEKANAESWRQQNENRVDDVLRISKELDIMREERDRLRDEVTRLRDLIPQAWSAGQARVIGSHKDFKQTHPTLQEWMKQKGLL